MTKDVYDDSSSDNRSGRTKHKHHKPYESYGEYLDNRKKRSGKRSHRRETYKDLFWKDSHQPDK